MRLTLPLCPYNVVPQEAVWDILSIPLFCFCTCRLQAYAKEESDQLVASTTATVYHHVHAGFVTGSFGKRACMLA
jgi:hypothetical protein